MGNRRSSRIGYNYTPEEQRRMEMRRKRVAARRRKMWQKRILTAIVIVLFVALIVGGISTLKKQSKETDKDQRALESEKTQEEQVVDVTQIPETTEVINPGNTEPATDPNSSRAPAIDSSAYQFARNDATTSLGSPEVTSTYALMVDLTGRQVVSQKNAYERINPASMTKILTLLVASEHITNLDDTFTMTIEITDYAYVNDCSSVGFLDGEVVTVKDLLYGTILPSGGDAAVGLATYVAGSQEAFVELMNQKLAELGLSETAHFTNCVGLYGDDHYCTLYDMAVILGAAMNNDLCREILNTRTYTTSITEQHPEGITVSNWFMRRIEDKEMGGTILGAKTGYVVQSGNCAASSYQRNDGREFICVTADAHSGWRAIYDHVAAYNIYAAGNTSYTKE